MPQRQQRVASKQCCESATRDELMIHMTDWFKKANLSLIYRPHFLFFNTYGVHSAPNHSISVVCLGGVGAVLLWSRPSVISQLVCRSSLNVRGLWCKECLRPPPSHLCHTYSRRPAVPRMSTLTHPWQGFRQLLTNRTIALLHHRNCHRPTNILPQK